MVALGPLDAGTKLTDLIRIGAQRRPQCFGAYFSADGGSCALGAAMEALTGTTNVRTGIKALRRRFRGLLVLNNLLTCPVARHEIGGRRQLYIGLSGLVTHFNNDHRWSRERIADWLEALGF
jgi:hypothetical protein